MQIDELLALVTAELDERKGQSISVIDVKDRTSVTDFMILVTASSTRHAQSLSAYVSEKVKKQGFKPLGIEGEQGSDWVLLDLGDILLHIMTAQARELYQLEKLWSLDTRVAEVEKTL
ncbi:MAG: ribosome silencing factor [Methylococcaceae bacterium]|nr:ribosome silencing factor [Methylococcaceae bacterium]